MLGGDAWENDDKFSSLSGEDGCEYDAIVVGVVGMFVALPIGGSIIARTDPNRQNTHERLFDPVNKTQDGPTDGLSGGTRSQWESFRRTADDVRVRNGTHAQ